jgi:hypothetical protein
MAKSVGIVCFVAAALFSGCCSAQTIVGPSGKSLQPVHRAKCSQSPAGCYEQATRDCLCSSLPQSSTTRLDEIKERMEAG